MKTKTIVLKAYAGDLYYVVSVTNSVAYSPGQELKRSEVERLCKEPYWKVVIRAKS